MNAQHQAGLTLIELLIASAILAVFAAVAYSGVLNLRIQQEAHEASLARTYEIQKAFRIMERDFMQLQPRPIRDDLGTGLIGALVTDSVSGADLEFTTSGWSNPLGFKRSEFQRVAYFINSENVLERSRWPVLDRVLGSEPSTRPLLKDISRFEMRFLDRNLEWQTDWPPLNSTTGLQFDARPVAIELVAELEDWGEIRRIFEVLR